MAKTRKIIFCTLIFVLLLAVSAYSADFEDYYTREAVGDETAPAIVPDQVILNADRVSFNDETGHALAEGNAVLQYNGTTIMAERIEYDADSQKVKAMPLPGEKIVMKNGGRTLNGDQVDYD
ncbi:MAG: hypothetical protein IJQ24_06685, partial [Synergistaceae bacterium]|nr:hypothetical protein [Synergistaceae bacterium]